MKAMLREFSEEQSLPEVGTVIAEDQMDDGTPIRVGLSAPCLGCSQIRRHVQEGFISGIPTGNIRTLTTVSRPRPRLESPL